MTKKNLVVATQNAKNEMIGESLENYGRKFDFKPLFTVNNMRKDGYSDEEIKDFCHYCGVYDDSEDKLLDGYPSMK